MEDSHYFLKNIGLEGYMGQDKPFDDSLSRVDLDTLEYDTNIKPEENKSSKETKNEDGEKQDTLVTANVQADDFFSSLELQSSSKSSNVLNLNYPNKSGGIVTRSRTFSSTFHEIPKFPLKALSHSKTKEKLKRDFKKREIDKSKKGRRVKTKKRNKKLQGAKKSLPDGKDKVSGLSDTKKPNLNKLEENVLEKCLGVEKGKEDDDWVLFNNLGSKKDGDDKVFENKQILGSDVQGQARRCTPELFSMNSILMSDTMSEGKDDVDKLLEVDDYDDSFLEEMDDFNYAPPRSHTGGKWKPGSLSIRTSPILWQHQTWDTLLDDRNHEEDGKTRTKTPIDSPTEILKFSSGGKWKSYAPPATHTGGKWKPQTPPATYTGGKWKPSEPPRVKKFDELPSPVDLDHNWKCDPGPPSTHTGGKWKPSHGPDKPDLTPVKAKSSKTVNRSTLDVLANCQNSSGKFLKTSGGMIQYYCSPCNRRLSSKKMFKKHVLSELHFKRVLQENELEFDPRSLKLFRGLFTQAGCRERELGKRVIKKPKMFDDTEEGKNELVQLKQKRTPKREVRCEVCKTKVPNHQLGKHLVSYYHSRRIQLNDPQQQKLILDNIHAIVKQAPYQCEMCHFYCNTHSLFKKHWALDVHKELEQNKNQRFWCALCSFECETSRSMELHLDSNSHREVILAVNKSLPIIIRHKVVFNCSICFKEFRFRRELFRHKKKFHKVTDADKAKCEVCNVNCKNMKSLQRHTIHYHKGDAAVPYFCSICKKDFATAEEARNHRNNLTHKYKKMLAKEGNSESVAPTRPCSFCEETFEDISKLKSHLFEKHPEFLPKCIRCGMVFALSQEVSRHVKNNECVPTLKSSIPGTYKCEICAFSCNLKSEFLLHATTHQNRENKKSKCPLCEAILTQTALRDHLSAHLNERPYQCFGCLKAFGRRNRLLAHIRSKHLGKNVTKAYEGKNEETVVEETSEKTEEKVEKPPEKGAAEEKKLEEGRKKCGDPKCKYEPKDLQDLEYHNATHIGPKMYQCPDCSYSGKTSTVVKRHYKIHLDERSFPCPHCSFKARLKSHLSRHLRLHTGAKPYKCPHCTYSCNILENLRKHVLHTTIHPGKKLYECKLCDFGTNWSKELKSHMFEIHKTDYRLSETNFAAGIYNREEDFRTVVTPLQVKPKKSQKEIPSKIDTANLKEKISQITQKLVPIASKSTDNLQKTDTSPKTSGNVEDKRKVLEMELEKLKKQIQPEVKKPHRSYPSPAEKELKTKMTKIETVGSKSVPGSKAVQKESDSVQTGLDDNGIVLLNIVPPVVSATEEDTQSKSVHRNNDQTDLSPAFVLFENVLPSEEMELYLLEDYEV